VVVNGNTRPVPGCTTVSECRSVLTSAGFQPTTVRVDSDKKEGDLVGTSPARGGRAVPGEVVAILVSNGRDYVEPAPTPAPQPPGPPATPGSPGIPGGIPQLPAGAPRLPDWVPLPGR
jgi:beta-lactam-binding protein with PASTA domain